MFYFFLIQDWLERAMEQEVRRRKAEGRPTAITAILKDAGLSPDTVYRIRRGEGPFSQATLDKVAEGLRAEPPKLEAVVAMEGERTGLEVVREIEVLLGELKALLSLGPAGPGQVSPSAGGGGATARETLDRAAQLRQQRTQKKAEKRDKGQGKKPA